MSPSTSVTDRILPAEPGVPGLPPWRPGSCPGDLKTNVKAQKDSMYVERTSVFLTGSCRSVKMAACLWEQHLSLGKMPGCVDTMSAQHGNYIFTLVHRVPVMRHPDRLGDHQRDAVPSDDARRPSDGVLPSLSIPAKKKQSSGKFSFRKTNELDNRVAK